MLMNRFQLKSSISNFISFFSLYGTFSFCLSNMWGVGVETSTLFLDSFVTVFCSIG